MRRFYRLITACVVYAILPVAISQGDVQPPQFNPVPVADSPSGDSGVDSSSTADSPAKSEELTDLGLLSPPTEMPLTKEPLDAAAPARDPLPVRTTGKSTSPPFEAELFLSPTQSPATPTDSPVTPAFGTPNSVHQPSNGAFELPLAEDSSVVDEGVLELHQPMIGGYEGQPIYTDAEDGGTVYDDTSLFNAATLPADCGPHGGGWDFGGWLSGGSTYNADGNRTSNGNAPLGFNNYADGLLLNQAWMYLAKETQTDGCGFDWGFRIDFMFGADGPDTQVRNNSWDNSWDTGGQYGFAMPQLYGEIAYNRTKTKFGHFYTILGYELVQAPYNFFYSHSYSRYYNQPFTHTGFLTQYELKPDLTLFGGWTAGWDSGFENTNDGSTFLGGAVWNVSDRFDVTYFATAGDPGDVPGNSDVYMHSLIGDLKFGYGWNYVLAWEYQSRESAGGPRTDSNGLNQYLFKQLCHNLSAGTRIEYFRDEDGARVGNGPGDYYETTFGFNWRPMNRMVVRPEIRWDWFEGAGLPYDNNTSRSLFTVGMDAVYVF